jgi:hypothetical protein
MPQILLEYYGDSSKTEQVSHVLVYDDRTDIYLFDNGEQHKQAFKFENADPIIKKGFNQAVSKTYANAFLSHQNRGVWLVNFSSILRTLNNTVWKTFDFNSCSAYGQSIPWVGSWENDNIEAAYLKKDAGSERPHLMSCQHANWGGCRLYVTLVTNNVNGAYLFMGAYPMRFRWWTLSWQFWDNEISSYEMFQTNVKLYGVKI